MVWSPSGRCLLLYGGDTRDKLLLEDDTKSSTETTAVGWLAVLDVSGPDRVLAHAKLVFGAGSQRDHCYTAAAWLPGSLGIVLSPDVQLQDRVSLQQAGFSVGTLPEQYMLHPASFHMGADHIVAKCPEQGTDFMSARTVQTLLRCSTSQQQTMFSREQALDWAAVSRLHEAGCFCFSMLMQQGWECPLPLVLHSWAPQSDPEVPAAENGHARLLQADRVLSLSGAFFVDKGPGGLCIGDMGSHAQVWDMATSDPAWSQLTHEQQQHAQQGLSLGLEAALASLNTPVQEESNESMMFDSGFQCDGWLPSGTGLLCRVDMGGLQPPSLQCIWFA